MRMNKREFLIGLTSATVAGAFAQTTSSLVREERDRPGAVHNVVEFGAIGDGKVSDSAAIQKALDSAGADGGSVYFPPGRYLCHDLKVRPHTTLWAEPQWGYKGDAGAMLLLDSDEADCLLDVTGAIGCRLHGLLLRGRPGAQKAIHGVFLNNAKQFSPEEDSIIIDDCKVEHFSGHGVYLLRVWLFVIRHSLMMFNKQCGVQIHGWDGFVTDNMFSANGSHGFGCEQVGATVMFTANRVEWNRGYGLHMTGGDAWNVTGNSFDRNWGAGVCALKMRATTVTGNLFRRCGKDSRALPEGERSCQVRLEECSGVTVTSNVFAAGKDDRGMGEVTPQFGFLLRKLSHSVIASNALFEGYTKDMAVDLGGHGPEYVFVSNVGCAK
jgi:hypothetical protein